MDDIRLFLDLEMNNKLKKALAHINAFIRAGSDSEAIQELDDAVSYLFEIRKGLESRIELGKK